MYAFGILQYEVLAQQLPYSELPITDAKLQIPAFVVSGGRPNAALLPPDTPTAVRDVMARCWAAKPADRPTAAEVETVIAAALSTLPVTPVLSPDAARLTEELARVKAAAAAALERERAAERAKVAALEAQLVALRLGAAESPLAASAPAAASSVVLGVPPRVVAPTMIPVLYLERSVQSQTYIGSRFGRGSARGLLMRLSGSGLATVQIRGGTLLASGAGGDYNTIQLW
jgi:hypothetical protein